MPVTLLLDVLRPIDLAPLHQGAVRFGPVPGIETPG
jgi:hypothetical protein